MFRDFLSLMLVKDTRCGYCVITTKMIYMVAIIVLISDGAKDLQPCRISNGEVVITVLTIIENRSRSSRRSLNYRRVHIHVVFQLSTIGFVPTTTSRETELKRGREKEGEKNTRVLGNVEPAASYSLLIPNAPIQFK